MKTALVAVALAAFVLPAHAVAVTFCVGTDTACTGVAKGNDLAGAFDDAATMPGADRIQIAAGTYKLPDGGVSYASADGVDVIGAGRGKTTVVAPGGTTLSLGGLGGAASRVRDITIVAPPGGYAIQTPGRVQGVEVIRIEGNPIGGVLLEGAGSFVGGRIEIGEGWSIVTTGDANRVADAELRSGGGVLTKGGSVLVERVSIPRCLTGLVAEGGKLVARDVLVVVVGTRAALLSRSTSAGDALVDAGQVTLVGPATAPAVRIESSHNGRKSEARVRNAIIAGFSTVLENPGTNIGLVDGGVAWYLDTDPRFVDPGSGNYRLKPDSPAIDKGEPGGLEPGESPTDLDGNPRIAGGRRDLGAYEYQPPPTRPSCDDRSVPVPNGTPTAVALRCSDPGGDPLTYSIVTGPTVGSIGPVDPSGKVIYTPKPGFGGNDTFTFKASDGTLDSRVATVRLTVAADTKAPAVGIAPATVAMSKGGVVRLRLSCPADESSCTGSLTLWHGRLVLGRVPRFQLQGGRSGFVSMRLGRAGRALVDKARRVRGRVIVAARDAAGNAGTSRRTITLTSRRR